VVILPNSENTNFNRDGVKEKVFKVVLQPLFKEPFWFFLYLDRLGVKSIYFF
jgi:hypothetical protein